MKFFQKILSVIPKSELAGNVILLTGGTVAAQIIPVLLQPFLRRTIEPEIFGAFAVYMSILGIVAIMGSLRYETAIVLPKNDVLAVNLLSLSVILSFVVSLILFIIIFFFKSFIIRISGFPVKFSVWLYLLPLSIFLFCVYQIFSYWLVRKKSFKSDSINKVSRRTFEGIAQVTGAIKHIPLSLVMGDIMGNFANVISGTIQLRKTNYKTRHISVKKMVLVFKKYIDFPKFNLLPTLLNTFCLLFPVLLINKYYSGETTAHFDLMRSILAVPAALLSTSISQVLLQNITERKNDNKTIKEVILRIISFLSIISIIEIVLIILFGKSLFSLYAGENYSISGYYAKYFVFSSAVKLIVSPISVVLISLQKLKVLGIWQFVYFLLLLCLIFVSNVTFEHFLLIYVLIDLIAYFLYFIIILRAINKWEQSLKFKNTIWRKSI
jgi:O-antigen/teichoic acid export membrane protein